MFGFGRKAKPLTQRFADVNDLLTEMQVTAKAALRRTGELSTTVASMVSGTYGVSAYYGPSGRVVYRYFDHDDAISCNRLLYRMNDRLRERGLSVNGAGTCLTTT